MAPDLDRGEGPFPGALPEVPAVGGHDIQAQPQVGDAMGQDAAAEAFFLPDDQIGIDQAGQYPPVFFSFKPPQSFTVTGPFWSWTNPMPAAG